MKEKYYLHLKKKQDHPSNIMYIKTEANGAG